MAPTGLEHAAITAPGEQHFKEAQTGIRSQQAAPKFTKDRGIEARIAEIQPQHVFPINTAADGISSLTIREVFSTLQDGDQRQLPRCKGRLPGRRKQVGKLSIGDQGSTLIGNEKIRMSLWKGGVGNTGCLCRDRRNWRGTERGTILLARPHVQVRIILALLEGVRQQYQECA